MYRLSSLVLIFASSLAIAAAPGDRALVALGNSFAVAIHNDGTMAGWGANGGGQLGLGAGASSYIGTPTDNGLTQVISVAGGQSFSLAVDADGAVWGTGSNSTGQLGLGDTTNRTTPEVIPTLSGVRTVAAGYGHALALRDDGTVWAWGSNNYGQVGNGTTTTQLAPVQVTGLSGITAIAAGGSSSFALTSTGTVYAWGSNGYGNLGIGSWTDQTSPVQIGSLSNVVAIAAGNVHSLALLGDGTVKAWGGGFSGQMGDGTTTTRITPITVPGLSNVAGIAAGAYHSLARTAGGVAYGWGAGNGACGGSTSSQLSPGAIALSSVTGVYSSGQSSNTVLQTSSGALYACGTNWSGQLGNGAFDGGQPSPVQVNW